MKTGIMQPYLFPYLGYYQLAFHVDNFVFLDDVNMIKRGYINRNKILLPGGIYNFSIPVKKCSQNRNINEHFFTGENATFLKTIENAYGRCLYFQETMAIVEKVLTSSEKNVARCCAQSISEVFKYIEAPFNFSFSSERPSHLRAQSRIIEICKELKTTEYINPIGGKEIYHQEDFSKEGMNLFFFEGIFDQYTQKNCSLNAKFTPKLSILDVLMNNSKLEIKNMIKLGKKLEAKSIEY